MRKRLIMTAAASLGCGYPLAMPLLPTASTAQASEAHEAEAPDWRSWVDCAPSLMADMSRGLPINPVTDFRRVTEAISTQGFPYTLTLKLSQTNDPASPLADLPTGFREIASQITVEGNQITVQAETIVGLSGGLYKILEDWGCRWVLPGELGEVLPPPGKLTLAEGKRKVVPGSDVAFGGSSAKGEPGIWNQRNRAFPVSSLPCTHFWLKGLEPAKYLENHPEYYALVDGKRVPSQPETINPEVVRLKVEHAKAYFRTYPNARSYPMDPEDNTFFSEAPEAAKLDPEGVGLDGLPLLTDRVVHFSNAVRDGFKDEFPNRLVGFYAYLNHSLPPVNQKVDPHTAVGITRFGYCTLRLTPNPFSDSAEKFEALVKAWLEHTEHVYVYDYNPPPWAAALPFPTYQTMAESIQRLSRMGVKGFYSDVPYGASFAPGVFLNTYLRRRMMIEPEQDPAGLMDEYCDGFFANAGRQMRRYYAEMETITARKLPGRNAIGVSIYGYEELFPRETVARATALLEEALAQKVEPVVKKRIEMVALSHHYLSSVLSAVDAAKSGDLAKSEASFQEAYRNIVRQERMMGSLANMDDARKRIKALQATMDATYFPKKRGAVTRWQVANLVPRMQIAPGQDAQVFTGGHQVRWTPYQLKTGIVDFNELLRKNRGGQPLAKAFAKTKIIVPKEIEATLLYGTFFPSQIYVNGERLLNMTGPAFFNPDVIQRKATLKAGVNEIWIMSDENARSTADNPISDGIQWSFTLAIQDAAGQPVKFNVQ